MPRHAAFKIETKQFTFLIDPWIVGNPVSPLKITKRLKRQILF